MRSIYAVLLITILALFGCAGRDFNSQNTLCFPAEVSQEILIWDLISVLTGSYGDERAYLFEYEYDEARASVLFIERDARLIPIWIDLEPNTPQGNVWRRDQGARGCVWYREGKDI